MGQVALWLGFQPEVYLASYPVPDGVFFGVLTNPNISFTIVAVGAFHEQGYRRCQTSARRSKPRTGFTPSAGTGRDSPGSNKRPTVGLSSHLSPSRERAASAP